MSAASNGLRATTVGGGTEIKPEIGAQLHVTNPAAGRWTLVIDFYNTVSGTGVAQPFTISLNGTVSASASGLPDAAGTHLTAGKPVTADVTVTNNGTTPEAYFVDPRLNSQVTLGLAAQSTSTLTLPDVDGVVPQYLVPSHTTAIKATVSASAPVFFDITYPYGDPDLISTTGKTATRSYSATDVGAGDWTVTAFRPGPTRRRAGKNITAHVSMTATTAGFDPAVSSPTGDLWLASTNLGAPLQPLRGQPGPEHHDPGDDHAKRQGGTVVSGTLYLSDSSFVSPDLNFDVQPGTTPEGSDVAAFPYTYTIG